MLGDNIDLRTANVYGIYGHLGGGKSLTAVELTLYFLRLGFTVVSNIEVYHTVGYKGRFEFVEDFFTVDFWKLPCGAPRGSPDSFRSVIIIDECAEFFDQYSSGSPFVKQFLSWLRHSSKRGQFVFLIVQRPEFINKSLRLLINKWVVCIDMEQFRLPFFRCRIPFTRRYVWRRIFDKYGNLISRGWNFADKYEIGWYYNTAQSIALKGRENDYKTENSKPPLHVPLPFILAVLAWLLLLWYWQ